MRRYLATQGKMGTLPDWYLLIQAAKYLNVAPWELLERSIYWEERALDAMTAEVEAQEFLERMRK